ncbi:hypothetical protein [Acinetobacter ursingii]|uniref:hypothetical protein n=1 Tax=Acinetobacter ursingii TaxID=108980 RepID=UPI001D196A58|nr:hypothetical protein [Acinetobacter ursingii]UYF80719.1 hypothetical protein LSO59_12540 [Acinetobacter ursingii]
MMNQNSQGMQDAWHIQNHLGACTTKGKTDQEIAHIDERFFLACENLQDLKMRSDHAPPEYKPKALAKRTSGLMDYLDQAEEVVNSWPDWKREYRLF